MLTSWTGQLSDWRESWAGLSGAQENAVQVGLHPEQCLIPSPQHAGGEKEHFLAKDLYPQIVPLS